MLHASLALAALAAVTAARAPNDLAPDDLGRLQGDWKMVSGRQNGAYAAVPPDNPMRGAVRGDKVTFKRNGKVVEEATLKLDPSRDPAHIDLTLVASKQTVPGIYRIEGDTLTLCFARPGKSRPVDFSAKVESGQSQSVWKRDEQ